MYSLMPSFNTTIYKKIFFLIATLGVLILPLYFFIFNYPYYDWSGGKASVPLIYTTQKLTQTPLLTVEQTITPISNNLSKIIFLIEGKQSLEPIFLELIDPKNRMILRNDKINISTFSGYTEWIFEPIENSADKKFIIKINVPELMQNNPFLQIFIKHPYLPFYEEELKINGSLAPDKLLLMYYESRFTGPDEKIKIISERLGVIRPSFIKAILIPIFIIYVIFSGIIIWQITNWLFNKDNLSQR